MHLSKASSIAQQFFILLSLGHVARSPLRLALSMKSGVGFFMSFCISTKLTSGNIVMSPAYFCERIDLAFVRDVVNIPISARKFIRCRVSAIARLMNVDFQEAVL